MARTLAVTERHVAAADRAAYVAALLARGESATRSGAHFWAFEHANDGERFLEFIEAGSEPLVRALAAEMHSAKPDGDSAAIGITTNPVAASEIWRALGES